MSHHNPHNVPADPTPIGEHNIGRLLERAYHPEPADPAFVRGLRQRLVHLAHDEAERRVPVLLPVSSDLRALRLRLGLAMAVAASLAAVALFLHAWKDAPRSRQTVLESSPGTAAPAAGWLVPAARSNAPASDTLPVGVTLQAERPLRRTLPDGSFLYVNRDTSVRLEGDRHLNLLKGEVFLEVARPEAGPRPFLVKTPSRQVRALGTKFAVRADGPGPQVVVTQGQVECGPGLLVEAGQQLMADAVTPAPRASHLLAWARDLMAQASPRLVPASSYAGGALVAVNANGEQEPLSLRRYHVDVHIEDGFARTTIDQTYFNASYLRMEGTFHFPMPPDASLSRLAMYVANGQEAVLMEGGMAERDFARTVYESIVHRRLDPALLEWVDGSTFKMRVFPLEPRQEKRVILSYTQRLPSLYGRLQYRFPGGHNLNRVGEWAFHARVRHGAGCDWSSLTHTLEGSVEAGDLLLQASARDALLDRDVELSLLDRAALAEEQARFSTFEHEDGRYFMVRYRPSLPGNMHRQRRDWVILFESGADRNPILARAQIDIVQTILAHAEPDDTFALVAGASRMRTFAAEAVPLTPANLTQAVAFLEQSHLVGALDLEKMISTAKPYLAAAANPCLLHVGSGIPVLGQRRADVLVEMLPARVPYFGVGVGKRWGREFLKAAAERSGGYVTQINPDEPIAWRGFELLATLNTPRLHGLTVAGPGPGTFLTHASTLAQGEELCAVLRLPRGGLPTSVTVRGTLDGQPFERELPVENLTDQAGYLPRTWAKLEIDRLLAEDSLKNRERIVALSKAMYVMTPFTSLLVLENEEMYKQYQVDRGRKDHWAMYDCPPRIPVVEEQGAGPQAGDVQPGTRPSARDVAQTLLTRPVPAVLMRQQTDQPRLSQVRAGLRLSADHAYASLWGLESIRLWDIATTDTDIGLNPDIPAMYDISRIEEISVPGPVNPMDVIGVISAPQGPPMAIPPPPGFGIGGFAGVMGLGGGVWERPVQQLNHWTSLTDTETGTAAVWRDEAEQRFLTSLRQRSLTGTGVEDFRSPSPLFNPAGHDVLTTGVIPGQVPPVRVTSDGRVWHPKWLSVHGAADGRWPIGTVLTGSPVRKDAGRIPGLIPTGHLIYDQPRLSGNAYLFSDLLGYAPGMNTSRADVEAVIEAEAGPNPVSAMGRIDPAARALVEKARSLGWHTWKHLDRDGNVTFAATFDGSGRYRYEQTVSLGLRETVICDGRTLLHLYPEIGVGARRTVSRFHRDDWARLVPWVLPPTEDLARGWNLVAVDGRTIALVRTNGQAIRIEISFADDGRPCEWRTYSPSDGKLQSRLVMDRDTVSYYGPDGEKWLGRKGELVAAEAPDLQPTTDGLAVLPLPYRQLDSVEKAFSLRPGQVGIAENPSAALAVLASCVATGNSTTAQSVYTACFAEKQGCPLGIFTVLAACQVQPSQLPDRPNLKTRYADNPLARYLTTAFAEPAAGWATRQYMPPEDGLLARLEEFRILHQRWISPGYAGLTPEEKQEHYRQALAYVQRNPNAWGWALLARVADGIGQDPAALREVAAMWLSFQGVPALAYAAHYEHARTLYQAGDIVAGRRAFTDLHEKALNAGFLPPIDETFIEAVCEGGEEPATWEQMVRNTAQGLVTRNAGMLAIELADQCYLLGYERLAAEVLDLALTGPDNTADRLEVTLAEIDLLCRLNQNARALQVLGKVLRDPALSGEAALWRLAAALALREHDVDQTLFYLERALALHYRDWSQGVHVSQFRREYTGLLQLYLLRASRASGTDERQDLADRMIRVADRWRALDSEPGQACELAGKALYRLGYRDRGWEYLSSALAYQPGSAQAWDRAGGVLADHKERRQADQLFAVAVEIEGTDPTYLLHRALNLQHAGRRNEAVELLRKIVAGTWHNRFSWTVAEANRMLASR